MGVYINRDELMELYANTDELDISNYDVKIAVIRQNILDMPTIDLVRCGECMHYTDHDCPIDWESLTVNDFCSYGERRTDE